MENPMEVYNDAQFKKRYRFRKDIVHDIILPMIGQQEPITNRGLPVPFLMSVLLTLRFYATGSLQIVCGDLRRLHQATVSRVVRRITDRISTQSRNFIKFPRVGEELQEVYRKFNRIANFPNVTGCIDCTHVPIKNPGGPHAELFRNRKRTFSINVQVVGGPNLEIYNIVARYPGSYHDSHIFNRSSVKGMFQRRELPGYLLGDGGYPCLPYLLTPFRQPRTPREIRYSRAHIRTRNTVERLFGVLKRKFSCLSKKLGNKIETSCSIIVACAILYNIAIIHQRDVIDDLDDMNVDIHNDDIDVPMPVPKRWFR
ncbi:putative nuclease HARBI1 [Aethina tumida]|uniref:putative nuclease HARBI1 n=1 Tax=Aethina tumida TaxID=116153 RepID=UPI002147ABFA|nr:putative nuclease HARBI1 [Aethina tumida]